MKIVFWILLLLVGALHPASLSQASYAPIEVYKGPGALVQYLADRYKRPELEMARIVQYAYEFGNVKSFPTPLDILSVIAVESRFDPKAEHPVGPSQGLMQVNLGVHKTPDLKTISTNIKKGVEILSQYRSLTKTDHHALVYYNAGPGGAKNLCPPGIPCKTGYSEKVQALKKKLAQVAKKENVCLSSSAP